jgi:hypothetical protein
MGLGFRTATVAIAMCAVPLAGCSGGTPEEPECSARVGYADNTYRPTNGLHTPRRGAALAESSYLGCDGERSDGLGTVQLYEVAGEDPSVVVLAAEEGLDTVYYNDAMTWAKRPEFMKDAEHYLTCSGPARFTGSWRWIEPEDLANSEAFDSLEVPYTGNFETSDGKGVALDRWATVSLQAEVTAETSPVPDGALFRRATLDREPVQVSLRCRDGAFEVAIIRIAEAAAAPVG